MNGAKTLMCCIASAALGALAVYGLNLRHEGSADSQPALPIQEAQLTPKKVLYWYDPMVPDKHFDKPGKSPFMDMELVPKYAEAEELTNTRSPQQTPSAEKKVLYWYDPMVPNKHFDKPGKSPFMDMELVPKYAEPEMASAPGIRLDPGLQQNLALRRVRVERKVQSEPLDVVGTVRFNERDVAIVQARSIGFVERVYAHAPGDVIEANAPLADVLMPEWAGAQAEFLALRRSGDRALIDSTRQRLQWLGMSRDFIASVERSGQVQAVVTITSPIAGVIRSLSVRAGMALQSGTTLAEINGIDPLWLDAAVPEIAAARVQVGQALRVRLPAFPSEIFEGRVQAILPQNEPDSRTLTIRAEFKNNGARLRPGMLAQVHIETGDQQPRLWVPSEAVIRTGKRAVVIVQVDSGAFAAVEVELGAETQTDLEVRRGLEEGQMVVASGQFLLESEANLTGLLRKLAPAEGEQP